jgi:hypothetical protein
MIQLFRKIMQGLRGNRLNGGRKKGGFMVDAFSG